MKQHEHCPPHVTPETCESIMITFDDGKQLIQRRDRKPSIKPLVKGKKLTELAEGDFFEYEGEAYQVESIELYR